MINYCAFFSKYSVAYRRLFIHACKAAGKTLHHTKRERMPAPRLFDLPNGRGRPRLPPSHQSRTRSAGLQRPPPTALGNLKSLECSEFPRDYWLSRDFWLRSLEDRFPRDYWLSPSTLLTRNTPITIINEFCSRHKLRIKECPSRALTSASGSSNYWLRSNGPKDTTAT